MEDLILGIDIGTTKVAAIITATNGNLLSISSKPHNADISPSENLKEQSVPALIDAVKDIVLELPQDLKKQLKCIGVTGQMHGIVLLNRYKQPLTPLITWQDRRCSETFLNSISTKTNYLLKNGYGIATLAWSYATSKVPTEVRFASSIPDYLVSLLCSSEKIVTDPTMAASWGLFDENTLNWDEDAINIIGIHLEILPPIVSCGAKAGNLCENMAQVLGIPPGIPISTAIGDNQASVLAVSYEPERDVVLTIGTGSQLSVVVNRKSNHTSNESHSNTHFEYRPYPEMKMLAVTISQKGGWVWSEFADQVARLLAERGQKDVPKSLLYQRLNELGIQYKTKSSITVNTYNFSEQSTDLLNNAELNIGYKAYNISKQIIQELKETMPKQFLEGREKIIGTGNALRRIPLLQEVTKEQFDLPLFINNKKEESAYGAALNASSLIKTTNSYLIKNE